MVGIYKIENLLSGEVYIGQSKDIENRIKEHRYHNQSYIDKVLHDIGFENFSFSILEICNEEELDEKEDYYILQFRSNETGYGYNLNRGGQYIKSGEFNNNHKLTEKEVYAIREAYKNHERKYEVYELYKHKISKDYFSNLWEGRSWPNIHCDVYTEENINYYKRETSLGENSNSAVFTNEEVLNLRKLYVTKSAKEIYSTVSDKCSFQTLQCILWGRYYKNIPIYNKKEKRWINY